MNQGLQIYLFKPLFPSKKGFIYKLFYPLLLIKKGDI